ncbi:hypothetical protein Lal_00013299 [Lupinus albus]|nr:hypothetical protein Lal_00013299 [Lupinus albus]
MGSCHHNSLLLDFSRIAYALHYCMGLAHPPNLVPYKHSGVVLEFTGMVRQAHAIVQRIGDANLISCGPMTHISDIKLIRTDTTLDLSQKAEKGMSLPNAGLLIYILSPLCSFLASKMWD